MTDRRKQPGDDMFATKAVSILVACAVFLASLVLPPMFINCIRGKMSSIENRFFVVFSEIFTPDGLVEILLLEFGRLHSFGDSTVMRRFQICGEVYMEGGE
jgi:hypothetical protein